MTQTDGLPQLFEEQRDEYDDAVDAVNLAVQRHPIPAHPDDPAGLIDQATRALGIELPNTRQTTIGAVETVIQRRHGDEPPVRDE
ncbi:hypothetical protein [Halostella pelagica]|uniref:hypothetical protein n=1 Tax=Halostella pelagica TaxID=2583824 RepID=UPI001081BBB3|nr:hypothetical protein [Halostella pelagica]